MIEKSHTEDTPRTSWTPPVRAKNHGKNTLENVVFRENHSFHENSPNIVQKVDKMIQKVTNITSKESQHAPTSR